MAIMKRNEFLKKAALGLGSTVLVPSLIKALPVKNTFHESNSKIIRNNEGKKINVIGDNMTVKLTGADTSGQFGLIEENNDPGVGIPPERLAIPRGFLRPWHRWQIVRPRSRPH